MVNMTHNTDNGRSGDHILIFFIVFLKELFDHIHLDFLFAEDVIFHGNVFCLFIRDLLVHGYHFTFQEKLLDDGGRLYLHLICQILNGNGFRQYDDLDCLFNNFFLLLLRLYESAGLVL